MPYKAQYSHANADAFVLLSRFMPPAPRTNIKNESSLIPSDSAGMECSDDASMEDISADASFNLAYGATENPKAVCLSAISEDCEFKSQVATEADTAPVLASKELTVEESHQTTNDSSACGGEASERSSEEDNQVRSPQDCEGNDPRALRAQSRDTSSPKTAESQSLDPADLIRASWWSCLQGNACTSGAVTTQEISPNSNSVVGVAGSVGSGAVIENFKGGKILSSQNNVSASEPPDEKESVSDGCICPPDGSADSNLSRVSPMSETPAAQLPEAATLTLSEKDAMTQNEGGIVTDKDGPSEGLPELEVGLPNDVETSAASGPEFDEDESLPQKEKEDEGSDVNKVTSHTANEAENLCTKEIRDDERGSGVLPGVELTHSQKRDRTQWEADLEMCKDDDIDLRPRAKRRRTSGLVENIGNVCSNDNNCSIDDHDEIEISSEGAERIESVPSAVVELEGKESSCESGKHGLESGHASSQPLPVNMQDHPLEPAHFNVGTKSSQSGDDSTDSIVRSMLDEDDTGFRDQEYVTSGAKSTMRGHSTLPESDNSLIHERAKCEAMPNQDPENALFSPDDKCAVASGPSSSLSCGNGPGIDEADLTVEGASAHCEASANNGVVCDLLGCCGNDSECHQKYEGTTNQSVSMSVHGVSMEDSGLAVKSEGVIQRVSSFLPSTVDNSATGDAVELDQEEHTKAKEGGALSNELLIPESVGCAKVGGGDIVANPAASVYKQGDVDESQSGREDAHCEPSIETKREESESDDLSGPKENNLGADLYSELDQEAVELLSGEESTLWINGSLIRQVLLKILVQCNTNSENLIWFLFILPLVCFKNLKLGDSPANLFKLTKVLMATPQGRHLGYHTPFTHLKNSKCCLTKNSKCVL